MKEVRLNRRLPVTKERLTKRVREISGPLDTPCWEWQGCKNSDSGYGVLEITDEENRRRAIQAHRASYELFNGEIPEGLSVLHKCDNRSCINPEHLFVGTQRENVLDCISKDRHSRGERNGISKLTDDKVLIIRELAKEGYEVKLLAEEFGVNICTIYRAIKGQTWKHLNKNSEG